jgi:hypothetical protein
MRLCVCECERDTLHLLGTAAGTSDIQAFVGFLGLSGNCRDGIWNGLLALPSKSVPVHHLISHSAPLDTERLQVGPTASTRRAEMLSALRPHLLQKS